ncbi:MAG: hypothetical protein ACK506_16615 [Pirellula sp.]
MFKTKISISNSFGIACAIAKIRMSHDSVMSEQVDVPNFTRETYASDESLRRRLAAWE